MNKIQEDSDRIFTTISTGSFKTYAEAEQAVLMLYVPDMSFDRGGICEALHKLRQHFYAQEQK